MYASEAVQFLQQQQQQQQQRQQQRQQKQQRDSCFPTCKPPDKRDFMNSNPPRTADDFYHHYDPWIGIGTAMILAFFFFLLAIKTFITWLVRKVSIWRYRGQKYRNEKRETDYKLSNNTTTTTSATTATTSIPIVDNGQVVIG